MSVQNVFTAKNFDLKNRAFLHGDAVKVFFFIRNSELVLAEECYFFLMASMRKMRMNIPLTYTLEYFQDLFSENVLKKGTENGIITFMAYRDQDERPLQKSGTSFYFEVNETADIFTLREGIELDLIKELSVNTHLLSNIHVHCPENVYAEVYARENNLDDVILLNPHKRIARSVFGNLVFLEGNTLKVPKQIEGAFISPLMESLMTFVHRNALAEIEQAEMIAFESQKAEEILMISDEKGIFPVVKIRNKSFSTTRFEDILEKWRSSFL